MVLNMENLKNIELKNIIGGAYQKPINLGGTSKNFKVIIELPTPIKPKLEFI